MRAVLGKPIAVIDASCETFAGTEGITLRSVPIGERVTGALIRRATRELLQGGAYAAVRVQAVAQAGGRVVLQVRAVARRLAATVRVAGGVLDDEAMLQQLRLSVGEELTPAMLRASRDQAREYYVHHGYPSAKVEIELHPTDDPVQVGLVFRIVPGEVRTVAKRIFVHDGLRIDPTLDPYLEEVEHGYTADEGQRVDEDALGAADRALTELLRARRYLQAEVTHQTVDAGGRTYLYVRIRTGPKYIVQYEGVRWFDCDDLEQALELDRQPNRSTGHLAGKIANFYRMRGFMDVVVEGEERGGPGAAVHVLFFRVRENNQVRVAAREFPCLAGGPLSAGEARREIDSFLFEELPGGGILGPVSSARVDTMQASSQFSGTRAEPLELSPSHTYVDDTYERALKHLQDYYRSQGYLSATVGPVTLMRRACDWRLPPGQCVPRPLAPTTRRACLFDSEGLPIDEPPPDPALTCTPDPSRGITCEPNIAVQIPIKLGPRTVLHDVSFEGNRDLIETDLAAAADLTLGEPLSQTQIEDARRRVLDEFKEEGFAFAEVRSSLDFSPDRTRGRARFVITQGERVVVDRIVVRGAKRTDTALVLRRVALRVCPPDKPASECEPYRMSRVRRTEERIATLGTFSSVSVALEDPYVPARRKTVVIDVQERTPQYLDVKPGFSSGQGFRGTIEYGHYNIFGRAIQVTARAQFSYLPDAFILDPGVRQNWFCSPPTPQCTPLQGFDRVGRMITGSLVVPEIGLGPQFRGGLDIIVLRQNARDFGLTKQAAIPTVTYRPMRSLYLQAGLSFESNLIKIFQGGSVTDYLRGAQLIGTSLSQLLRAPDGQTYVIAERLLVNWDRRDMPLGATRGTFLQGSVEHVHAYPDPNNTSKECKDASGQDVPCPSDFLRFSGTLAGYLRLTQGGMALAVSVRAGRNLQLVDHSTTYPDRLFFLGGVNSLRGFLQDTLIPQDLADSVQDGTVKLDLVALRGGNVFVNPRLELRVPVTGILELGFFMDSGNLWVKAKHFDPFNLRYAAGAGLRFATPIGPIAFDYGINLEKREVLQEDRGNFHFSIGLF